MIYSPPPSKVKVSYEVCFLFDELSMEKWSKCHFLRKLKFPLMTPNGLH